MLAPPPQNLYFRLPFYARVSAFLLTNVCFCAVSLTALQSQSQSSTRHAACGCWCSRRAGLHNQWMNRCQNPINLPSRVYMCVHALIQVRLSADGRFSIAGIVLILPAPFSIHSLITVARNSPFLYNALFNKYEFQ